MKSKKKPNIVLYTIFMIVVFLILTEVVIWGYGSGLLMNTIINYPQGNLVISEAILASLVLIVMLLFKNSYVFTQKREKFTKGFFYGLYYVIGIVLFIILNGISGGFKGGLSTLNLLIGCFFVGVAEEFLCRGWLLNEFLERFGDTKKGTWYSIIVSGIIFGLMHLGNIYTMGQSVPTTVMQVISAAGTGIVFGLIYYKTKNIWTVILLHGLWDFALMLNLIVPVTSTIELVSEFSIIGTFFSLLMIGAELLNIIPYIKDIDSEPKKSSVITFSIVGIVLYILFASITGLATMNIGDEYVFDSINIKNYAITKDNYDEYFISHEDYSFKLSKNNKNNLIFTNLKTNYSVEFECESLYDYIIMEETDYYVLAYVDYMNSANPFLKYVYINKDELSNNDNFLNDIKAKIKKYLLAERSELLVISDRENKTSYLSAYNVDYGYYLLISEDKMSILNRE